VVKRVGYRGLLQGEDDQPREEPQSQSDDGSGFVAREDPTNSFEAKRSCGEGWRRPGTAAAKGTWACTKDASP
jgi:hypothetical protein